MFSSLIYKPLMRDMDASKVFENARDPLLEAVASGRIEYRAGEFTGPFNASISKRLQQIGAVWNRRGKSFLLKGLLPPEISFAVATADSRYKTLVRSMVNTLDAIDVSYVVDRNDTLAEDYQESITKMDAAFYQNLKRIEIPPVFTPAAKKKLARDWSRNLKLYIKKWADHEILELRQKVQANAFRGQRSENLLKTITDSYGVSRRKAKFLARQETSLLMASMREQRYLDAGITRYKWSTSHDERVRHRHEELDGKIYFFKSPPIVNNKGDRLNPGQDFNCRCVPIAILPGD